MSRRSMFPACALAAAFSLSCTAADVQRIEVGNRISENVPAADAALSARLQRYANTRSAGFGGWTASGDGVFITTRFGNTTQAHRVNAPGATREQLTFFDEPVVSLTPNPRRDGFVFGKDSGGSEFWQLYWFDLTTRQTHLLTDGKSRNDSPLWSRDGRQLAFSSTARNGTDTDVWLLDLDSGARKIVVDAGGTWSASDFSPDGKQLLVQRYVSINEMHPGIVDLASGKLTLFPVEGGKAAFGAFRFSPDGRRVYFTSDEGSEFVTLRVHDLATKRITPLSAKIPWDVEEFDLSPDGTRIAFASNEDGFSTLHVVDATTFAEVALPALPRGVMSHLHFSPDGRRVGFALNSTSSPNDVQSVDLDNHRVERWTTSEIGGLDAAKFVAPELVRFATFDKAGGKRRTIPAFYYRPNTQDGAKAPVVIRIHGGPESQARPVFNADIQFLVNELGVAVLVPNVRGSAGYGKGYLELDNGLKREDSVKDIGALLDWIATRPELDAKRVGVHGGSYGGYMVLAAMTHYNDRLRAGIDVVGISNFLTFLQHTESYRRDQRRAEYGDERDMKMKAFLARISPTASARNITIPLFVAAGANDPRVPPSEGQQIADTVRGNGGDVWFLEFRDEGHGFRKKPNVDFFREAMAQFWMKNLIGP